MTHGSSRLQRVLSIVSYGLSLSLTDVGKRVGAVQMKRVNGPEIDLRVDDTASTIQPVHLPVSPPPRHGEFIIDVGRGIYPVRCH